VRSFEGKQELSRSPRVGYKGCCRLLRASAFEFSRLCCGLVSQFVGRVIRLPLSFLGTSRVGIDDAWLVQRGSHVLDGLCGAHLVDTLV